MMGSFFDKHSTQVRLISDMENTDYQVKASVGIKTKKNFILTRALWVVVPDSHRWAARVETTNSTNDKLQQEHENTSFRFQVWKY